MNVRLLLMEDDATSRAFLLQALEDIGCKVMAVASIAAAKIAMESFEADAFVFDENLSDGKGSGLLEAIRNTGNRTPAICLSADLEDGIRRRISALEATVLLAKPCDSARLRQALDQLLHDQEMPKWNDKEAAKALGGSSEAVSKLRGLFIAELPAQMELLTRYMSNAEHPRLAAELHKLKSAAAFVGAHRLQNFIDDLSQELDDSAKQRALIEQLQSYLD